MANSFIDEYGIKQEDIFQEQQLISQFDAHIMNTNFHVYGVVADWGTGKTSFIRMWKQFAEEKHHEDSSFLYIDAFSKDYVEDPFEMLLSVFKQYMKSNNVPKEKGQKFIQCAKKICVSTLKASAIAASQLIPNEFWKNLSEAFFNEFSYDPEQESVDPCESLKSLLKEIIEENSSKKLYIIIDELDRCRPDFALETRERIKHLFSVDGVKFILVYNPKLISSIVKQKYGCGDFEAGNYIRKFVESEYEFSINTYFLENYIQSETNKLYSQNAIGEHEYRFITRIAADSIANTLVKFNRYALRDIKQFLPTIRIHSYGFSDGKDSGFWLAIALLKYLDKNEYDNIISYLAKNECKMSQAGSPKRSTYIYLMHLYSAETKTDDDLLKLFENNYKNLREYF